MYRLVCEACDETREVHTGFESVICGTCKNEMETVCEEELPREIEFLAGLGFRVEGWEVKPSGDFPPLLVTQATLEAFQLGSWTGADGRWYIDRDYYNQNRERMMRFHATIQKRLAKQGYRWKAHRDSMGSFFTYQKG
jgi:hypothetical protein